MMENTQDEQCGSAGRAHTAAQHISQLVLIHISSYVDMIKILRKNLTYDDLKKKMHVSDK